MKQQGRLSFGGRWVTWL